MTARNVIGAYMDRETDRYFAEQCRLARQGQDIPGDLMVPINAETMNADKPVYRPSLAVWCVVAATWPLMAWGVATVVQYFGGMW